MQRLFVALDIPDSIKAQLLDLQRVLPDDCRLVPLTNMHLTLVFIGMAEVSQVQHILGHIQHEPISLTTDAPGCFSRGKDTTFWVGFRHNTGLLSLQSLLHRTLREAGLAAPEGKAFRPHITLARGKNNHNADRKQNFLQQSLPRPPTVFPADHFTLYSSETFPEGPIYRVEARYPLTGPD